MTSSEDQLREYFEDLKRLRAQAEERGKEAFAEVEAGLEGVEDRAREVERQYAEYRAVPDAGRRLSDKLDDVVREIGEKIDECWQRLKNH